MKILYVPLDERPCNYRYPQYIARLQPTLQLIVPPLSLLSQKKRVADIDRLWQWLMGSLSNCDCAILSLEMLVYGGLLPSRLHQLSRETLHERLQQVRAIASLWPNIRLLASNLIMRAPRYSSSEEEPDYYETYGAQLFQWGWLQDRAQTAELLASEQAQLEALSATIPPQHLRDYRERRRKNLDVNLAAIDLVTDGVLEFLAIPQDDCAEFGFTASDHRQVHSCIQERNLHNRIHVYPGADEVGCSLLARAYARQASQPIKIYPLYSSVRGSQVIPLYEDRPISDSTELHIRATGADLAQSPDTADLVLAVRVPDRHSLEAKDQASQDQASSQSLSGFIQQIQHSIGRGKPLAVADVAFANGGDTALIEQLEAHSCWDAVLAYGGWNTCGNSLGSTIATAIVGLESKEKEAIAFNTIYHLLDDWGYQAIVRWELMEAWVAELGVSYFNLDGHTEDVELEIGRRLQELWDKTFQHTFQHWEIASLTVDSPWQRMFEIGMTLELQPRLGE